LPGSRSSELRRHVDTFLATAELCQREFQNLQCVIPVVNAAGEANIRAALAKRLARDAQACLAAPLICRHGVADALRAADAVLTASGTAAVETMLYKRPMVVAYRVARMTYWMLRRMLKVPYISMPNILAGRMLVPEFIQGAMVAERMAPQLIEWLHEPSTAQPLLEEFQRIHQSLRRGSGQSSAHAVLSLVRN
jgi:lipid-A-disaccharide synthase